MSLANTKKQIKFLFWSSVVILMSACLLVQVNTETIGTLRSSNSNLAHVIKAYADDITLLKDDNNLIRTMLSQNPSALIK